MRMMYRSTGSKRTRRSSSPKTSTPTHPLPLLPQSLRFLHLADGAKRRNMALLLLIAVLTCAGTARAQGPLINGWTHTGTIAPGGEVDSWTFTAALGDRIVVRVGEISQTNTFTPRIRLMNPSGVQQATASGAVAAEVSVAATNAGTFTVTIDGVNATATGEYRLTLAKIPGAVTVAPGDEGGPLTNGVMHTGTISAGDLDVWSFNAASGENMTLEIGETVSASSLTPALWFYGPDGRLLDSGSGVAATQVSFRATNSGTFTIVAGDFSSGYAGSGTYRLTMAKTGSPIIVSSGDEGGTLINGVMHTGKIDVGDLDVWNFSAVSGESLVVAMGETVSGGTLRPVLWFYGPDGRLLDWYNGTAAAQVFFRATNSGTFTVVAGDYSSAYSGSGDYRLTLAKTGNAVEVSPGDEGGRLNGSAVYESMLDVGDLDVWSFTLCAGDNISLRLDEAVVGSSLTPWLRLYGHDGTLMRSVSGTSTVQVNVTATNNGTFMVVAGDFSSAYSGSGAYQLTMNGLSHDMRLCVPRISGTNLTFSGVGGENGTDFVVITSPLVEAPLSTWTPLFTNQFDFYGTFIRSNSYPKTDPRRFFTIRQPGAPNPN